MVGEKIAVHEEPRFFLLQPAERDWSKISFGPPIKYIAWSYQEAC
jgi:hypothetical protein